MDSVTIGTLAMLLLLIPLRFIFSAVAALTINAFGIQNPLFWVPIVLILAPNLVDYLFVRYEQNSEGFNIRVFGNSILKIDQQRIVSIEKLNLFLSGSVWGFQVPLSWIWGSYYSIRIKGDVYIFLSSLVRPVNNSKEV
jgi:hypothetical protein